VLLLTRGDVTTRMARANFCLNFFGCAGFDIVDRDRLEGSVPDLIVLCSSDPEYLPFAQDICPQTSVPVLVAGNPVAQVDALRAAGVQGFVYRDTDIVQTLTEWQRRLGMEA
jgi:methylmalonyl-CoA mutase